MKKKSGLLIGYILKVTLTVSLEISVANTYELKGVMLLFYLLTTGILAWSLIEEGRVIFQAYKKEKGNKKI